MGKTYGTAKKARVYSIRVLDCSNRGRVSTVLDGIDYVSKAIAERGRPAVVSMSLGARYMLSINNAIRKLHSEGIIMVAAAGNDRGDACNTSPASSRHLITVGGTANGDGIYIDTNSGSCVDIFAPGSRVLAAGYRCVTCTRTFSGTSMATPKVSGVAAIHLQREPGLGPDDMKLRLTSTATPNVIDLSSLSSRYRSSTPNLLLYIESKLA